MAGAYRAARHGACYERRLDRERLPRDFDVAERLRRSARGGRRTLPTAAGPLSRTPTLIEQLIGLARPQLMLLRFARRLNRRPIFAVEQSVNNLLPNPTEHQLRSLRQTIEEPT